MHAYCRFVYPKRPYVYLDEKPVQRRSDVREPLGPRPRETAKQDHEYQRNGTANNFVAFEPLANWRTLLVADQRTKVDFAHFIKALLLLDGRYREAEKVVLVTDQLNTHTVVSLYEAKCHDLLAEFKEQRFFGPRHTVASGSH